MKKISKELCGLTMDAYAFFPGRKNATIKITEHLENLAAIGGEESNEMARSVLDRLYFQGDNDQRGIFLISDEERVRVYVCVRDGFKRVI